MPRLIWSSPALRDVSRLFRFLAAKNPNAARRAVEAIRRGVRILAQHPQAGRPVEDMAPQFREWRVDFASGAYLVLYRVDAEGVTLLAVRHSREAEY